MKHTDVLGGDHAGADGPAVSAGQADQPARVEGAGQGDVVAGAGQTPSRAGLAGPLAHQEANRSSPQAILDWWHASGTGISVYVKLKNGNEPMYMGGMSTHFATPQDLDAAIRWLRVLLSEAEFQESHVMGERRA